MSITPGTQPAQGQPQPRQATSPEQPSSPTPEQEMDFYERLQAQRHLSDFDALRLLTEASLVAGALPAQQADGLLKIMDRERRRLKRQLQAEPIPSTA